MSSIIAVDLDDTVVDMRSEWLSYCLKGCNVNPSKFMASYNLCDYFGEKAMEFWSQENLYDTLEPIKEAKEVLDMLNSKGFEIGFCSYTKKAHFSSKCEFIKKHFPYYKFIMNTKEKSYVRANFVVEDNPAHLVSQPEGVVRILIETPNVIHEYDKSKVDFVVTEWSTIGNIITNFRDWL